MTLLTDTPKWMLIKGSDTEIFMNGLTMQNLSLYRSSAVEFTGTFNSITMSNLSFENITLDTDTSAVTFESLKMLHLDGATFNNISSSSESVNNFMIEIEQTGKT